ncbi:putative lipid II flippase FtsW [Gordonia sp. NPDC003376]
MSADTADPDRITRDTAPADGARAEDPGDAAPRPRGPKTAAGRAAAAKRAARSGAVTTRDASTGGGGAVRTSAVGDSAEDPTSSATGFDESQADDGPAVDTATDEKRSGDTAADDESSGQKTAAKKPGTQRAGAEAATDVRTPDKRAGVTTPTPRDAVRATGSVVATVVEGVRTLLARPLASYHLILALALLLTVFGLVMVLSASSVEGYSKQGSAYGLFATQVIFAILGMGVFYLTLRLPVRLLRRLAAPLMVITTLLLALVLVPGIGTLSGGARRWFTLGGLSVQPSELVKVALCVWGAHLLASRRRENAPLKELLIPLLPVGLLVCLLIILEPNLSTTITIAIIIGTLLWFAGLPIKVFSAFAVSGIAIAVVLALVEGYRSERVMSFLGGIDDPQGAGYQARQATYALANGGVFGVGLGQSRAKWNYLPNAHNDFIFAIIGEELGLIGGLMVVALFVFFAYVGFRVATRSADPFLRLMTVTITVLITAQAFINIGYVIGLLPVTGIQLPLLSAGGTSTLTVLAMLGLLANAARHEPEAVAALSTTAPRRFGRLFRLPTPVAYQPTRAETLRDRLADRRRTVPAGPAPGRSGRSRGAAPAAAPSRLAGMWPGARRNAPEPVRHDRPRGGSAGRPTPRGGYSPGARTNSRSTTGTPRSSAAGATHAWIPSRSPSRGYRPGSRAVPDDRREQRRSDGSRSEPGRSGRRRGGDPGRSRGGW